jgi:hypothetical protein
MGFGKKKEAGSAQEQGSSNDEEGIAVSHEIGLGLHRVVQRGGQRGLALETQFDGLNCADNWRRHVGTIPLRIRGSTNYHVAFRTFVGI